VSAQRLAGELRSEDRLLGGFGAGRVRQQRNAGRLQRRQQRVVAAQQIHALHGERRHLAAAFAYRFQHQRRRREFTGAGKQA